MTNKTIAQRLREVEDLGCDAITLHRAMTDDKGAFKMKCHDDGCIACFAAVLSELADMIEAERELPKGACWPRFDDGEPVKIGDLVECEGNDGQMLGISFYKAKTWVRVGADCCYVCREHVPGNLFKRPPLLASDGKPIEIGQTLYGEDGIAWEVVKIKHGHRHPVRVVNAEKGKRGLKAKWLTHEQPVLDADGVPIKVGDTVYSTNDSGLICHPFSFVVTKVEKHLVSGVDEAKEGLDRNVGVLPCQLTHRKPDSMEAIEADAAKEPCVYFNGRTPDKCADCRIHDGTDANIDVLYDECRAAMCRDLLRRQRELMGGE